jgi:hypothetical protein
MSWNRPLLAALVFVLLLSRLAAAQVPNFNHVIVVIMENEESSSIIGSADAPYINSLASQNGLGTNYTGVTHPSLPNYMALTSGTTAFTDDCLTCTTPAPSLADRIEASGRTWKAYMEDMPAPCGVDDAGLYVAKHDPFVHYAAIRSNASRCGRVVPFAQLALDLASGQLPNFVWVTPNLCSDMHDCPVATGDAWLSTHLPAILRSPQFAGSVLFLVWDEGTSVIGGGGQIPLVTVSPWTPPGTRIATAANHYNLLRTIEDAWSLAPLGQSATAGAITAFFPPAGPTDQVIHARSVTSLAGAWTMVPDLTAADGLKLTTPDAGAAALGGPVATPASYFDATFSAVAGVRYRVWLRIHPRDDSKWNDSVFVQFSDSVDAGGAPIYRIGTTGGYAVNLWTCATCQTSGWGWQRNAYWLGDSGDVWFPTAGAHQIRVQVREDGIEVDQIVISPSTYVNSAPGSAQGDTTIVAETVGLLPPPPVPPPLPPPSNPEIVIDAIDLPAAALHGGWSLVPDAQSPGGVKAATADAGVASLEAPLASPSHYIDVTFSAPQGLEYRLWLRLKAQANSKYNDSIWVQFSDALAGGLSVYRLNTTSGLLVNLATDSTASGLSGWGWQNGAYWLAQAASVSFGSSGTHTLRIQVREDGVSVDQIVLSSSRYFSSAPGPVSNDNTIVPKP